MTFFLLSPTGWLLLCILEVVLARTLWARTAATLGPGGRWRQPMILMIRSFLRWLQDLVVAAAEATAVALAVAVVALLLAVMLIQLFLDPALRALGFGE
jgi:hypothetical protein